MTDFTTRWQKYAEELIHHGDMVDVGEWQSTPVNHPLQRFLELTFRTFSMPVPNSPITLAREVRPDLPWAEDHFLERVSGIPYNPPPSEKWWPWRDKSLDNVAFTEDGEKFSHTYPERYWPLGAGDMPPHVGIRYRYGDLADVIEQLKESPLTRQAYLPVWFPEDTGAVYKQRVPCSLGYHLIIRDSRLHCAYYIRSCDLLRHFRNDVYMTARLMQWIVDQLLGSVRDLQTGQLVMHITSLHCFVGDISRLNRLIQEVASDEEEEYGAPL